MHYWRLSPRVLLFGGIIEALQVSPRGIGCIGPFV
jgi:hypothetical protein